ncbi:hypothetical protein [Mycobacterium sp. 1245111.1]|uniref:hypothetical protein n=1 Tax=Mycobacterium sp. 1245111.1 TaxID=1834073 RepID=UPI000B1E45DE|nr:hypothetical protein [Mycobacterium sp. 1245111.1]
MSFAVETDLMDGAIVIAADQIAAAGTAAAGVLSVDPTQVSAELAALGFCAQWPAQPHAPLVIAGFSGQLDGTADAVITALAPFVDDGTTLDWEDTNGVKWRYLLTGGQVIEQTPVTVWRDVGDTTGRIGGLLAPLTFARDPEDYAVWWESGADCEAITETLGSLSERCEAEYGLHRLMLEVFQSCAPSAVSWLRVNGLSRGTEPGYLVLDMDVAYDGDGQLCGVEVVASMHVEHNDQRHWLKASVDVDNPWHHFASDLRPTRRPAWLASSTK